MKTSQLLNWYFRSVQFLRIKFFSLSTFEFFFVRQYFAVCVADRGSTTANHHFRSFIHYQTLTLHWPYRLTVWEGSSDIILCVLEFHCGQIDKCILDLANVHWQRPWDWGLLSTARSFKHCMCITFSTHFIYTSGSSTNTCVRKLKERETSNRQDFQATA